MGSDAISIAKRHARQDHYGRWPAAFRRWLGQLGFGFGPGRKWIIDPDYRRHYARAFRAGWRAAKRDSKSTDVRITTMEV